MEFDFLNCGPGADIDGLGFVFLRNVTSSVLTNVQYEGVERPTDLVTQVSPPLISACCWTFPRVLRIRKVLGADLWTFPRVLRIRRVLGADLCLCRNHGRENKGKIANKTILTCAQSAVPAQS